MNLVARLVTGLFGAGMVVYPMALHATPAVATLSGLAAALAALAVAKPRRLSGGPAVLVVAVAYAAAVAARGDMDLLAPLPAGAAFLFLQGVALCGLLASGAVADRDVIARRAREAVGIVLGGGVVGVAVLTFGAATAGSNELAFLVAVVACGLLLMLGSGSRAARRGPKGQDVP
jgi:hypothetical protein